MLEIKSNDATVFRQIYDNVFPVVMKVAFHITYNSDVAEELCQEAFERFYIKELVFSREEEAKFWLIRVVRNLSVNYMKKISRESEYVDGIMNISETDYSEGDGASELEKRESVRTVRSAVAKLPEIYKTVIVLREYADLSYSEIASVLHVSETAVKVRIYRARKALEEILGKEDMDVS